MKSDEQSHNAGPTCEEEGVVHVTRRVLLRLEEGVEVPERAGFFNQEEETRTNIESESNRFITQHNKEFEIGSYQQLPLLSRGRERASVLCAADSKEARWKPFVVK